MTITRRAFLASGSGVALAATMTHAMHSAPRADDPFRSTVGDDPRRSIVGASHANIDGVRELLGLDPSLAKASWDWGFGDHESAIGACSHTGRNDIIELLMSHGARPTLFTLATLDDVDSVRSVLSRQPSARTIEGPHSISLYRHAQAGRASRVLEYLESEGLDRGAEIFETDPALRERFTGTYTSGSTDVEIGWSDRFSCLTLAIDEGSSRNLIPVPRVEMDTSSEFRPAGSSGARILLTPRDDQEATLRIHYLGSTLEATKAKG